MAITLGTNLSSYMTRNNLNTVTDSLTATMEKLTTGLKINKAGDDAAGLVISENMEALIRGSRQAQVNIQNATSFLTVAEDGMVSVSEHLQRINDLLVNMANDTNDIDSRTAAVDEIIERINEINRLADSTNFNGRTMLSAKKDDEQIIVQLGPDNTKSSILDISPALSDCHTSKEALGVYLPGYLNPDAIYADDDTTIVIPKEELDKDGNKVTNYYLDDGTKYTGTVTPASAKSAYEPNNENCRKYMDIVQNAISKLSTQRGLLGAYENRMNSAYDSMTIRIESLETAKSHYVDTDVAQEATNLTMQQIKQQYNVALLANANSLPQLALSLLSA